ncbi:hypothetical protein [Lusitaniella coriacea]
MTLYCGISTPFFEFGNFGSFHHRAIASIISFSSLGNGNGFLRNRDL